MSIDCGLAHKKDSLDEAIDETDPDDVPKNPDATRVGAKMGTLRYMCPEALSDQSHRATPAFDQYSLGVTLYEMLTGQRPFEGPDELVVLNIINTPAVPPRTIRPEIPLDLEVICLTCDGQAARGALPRLP